MESLEDLQSFKYAELRKLAKKAGIKANLKQQKLIEELTKYYEGQKKTGTPVINNAKKCTPISQKAASPQVSVKVQTPKINTAPRTPVSVVKPVKKSKSTPIRSPASTNVASPAVSKIQATTLNTPSPASEKQATKKQSRWQKKEFTRISVNKNTTPVSESSSTNKSGSAKRNATDSPCSMQPAKKKSAAATSDLTSPQVNSTSKRRSTFGKAPTPDLTSPVIASPQKRRSSRQSASPGVKDILSKLDGNMTDEQMKESLMSAIDSKVKTSSAANSTGIPRFAAFAKMRAAEVKPITPGNKNWSKIHKKNFDKFDSIDVYLSKKRKRADEMSTSVKKAKTLLEEVHSVVNKLKSHKTPEANENKFTKTRKSNANKTTPFKPTIVNTTRMNLNFGSKKTPQTMPRKSPASVLLVEDKSDKSSANLARKSAGCSARKPTTTPFKFTAPLPSASMNKTVSSTKKVFDLKASLARPITWKVHTGKLKPLSATNTAQQSPVYSKTLSAAKTQTIRGNNRTTVAQRRADKKNKAQMARRGIAV